MTIFMLYILFVKLNYLRKHNVSYNRSAFFWRPIQCNNIVGLKHAIPFRLNHYFKMIFEKTS